MPGFGLGFVPAFARNRAAGTGATISGLTVLNGGSEAFAVPLAVSGGEGGSFTVAPVALDGDGNSFNVS